MECGKARLLMELVYEGLVTEEGKLLFKEHIQTCEDCRAEEKMFLDIESSLSGFPAPEPPRTLHSGIMRTLEAGEGFQTETASKRPAFIPAAAGILLAAAVQIAGAVLIFHYIKQTRIMNISLGILKGVWERAAGTGVFTALRNLDGFNLSGNTSRTAFLAAVICVLLLINFFFFFKTPRKRQAA